MTRSKRKTDIDSLVGQDKVIAMVRRMVDAWRGFALGTAAEAPPEVAPNYTPCTPGEQAVSETTMQLLQHWFRREPHVVGRPGARYAFKYWPHQRRLVETFIYLYEVRGLRRTEDLYALCDVSPLAPQRDPWAKLGGQMATGSGKTKMMGLLVAWSYLNAVIEGEQVLGFGRHSIIIAPGLFVRDRLLADFLPPHGGTSVFFADPVIPPAFERLWNLKVYSPATCPRQLDPEEGALVVTNYHQLLRSGDAAPVPGGGDKDSLAMLFEDDEPTRLEAVSTPLLERFSRSRGLLVLNDEAHHVGDEPAHAQFEQKAREKQKLGDEGADSMAWIRSLRRLHGPASAGRIALQADLSATLFDETGSTKKTVGTGKGAKPTTEFKPTDLFRHAVVRYGLPEAIRDEIVKRPVLERVVVRNKKTKELEPLVREGQANAWERYRNLLVTGIERWKHVRDQLAAEGDRRKPILFILCDNQHDAHEVANFLTHGEASRDDLSHRTPVGYTDPASKEQLFVETTSGGVRATVVEVHIGKKEQSNEKDWAAIRDIVNRIDHDALPDPTGAIYDNGQPLTMANPYNVVVSVMMLKEGWDVRNVKVIVPLRPCDSRTLTEQTLGRGLRKMHAPVLDDDGAAELGREELYIIEHPSFRALVGEIDDLVERKDSDEVSHAREYEPILPKADDSDRQAVGVRLVRFLGTTEISSDWRETFKVAPLPALAPKLAWLDSLAETEIQTFLKQALARAETDGLSFTLPEVPSYRDFDHVIEMAYAAPLLRDLRASFQHKNAVKGVVKEFLERKTFALPAGVPVSFDGVLADPETARIALGNLGRPEVLRRVHDALLPELRKAINEQKTSIRATTTESSSAELIGYQALKRNVMSPPPQRSAFAAGAFENNDELRVARLLEACSDVAGWVYNHRSGVGYSIEYDWQGYTAQYFPDFIARFRQGDVFHNVIIEVKGRLDDRDKAKMRRGRDYCDILSENDCERWHYLCLVENEPLKRRDISGWEGRSAKTLADVIRRHEALPLVPEGGSRARTIDVVPRVVSADEYRTALPVLDLEPAAGAFGDVQSPTPIGWAHVDLSRGLSKGMFVAKVTGKSMEPGVPDGSWCVFRSYRAGETPSITALDGRRIVAELRDHTDPATGGRYTLKRLHIAKLGARGAVSELALRPDNPSFATRIVKQDEHVRIVAELLEVIC